MKCPQCGYAGAFEEAGPMEQAAQQRSSKQQAADFVRQYEPVPDGWVVTVAELIPDAKNDWQREFLASVQARTNLSEKQRIAFQRIYKAIKGQDYVPVVAVAEMDPDLVPF